MKKDKKKLLGILVLLCGITICLNTKAIAQENEAENYRSLFYFNTTKNADNSRVLEVEFLARNKEDRKDKIAVTAAPIEFFNITDEDEISLGKVNTNKKGFARLTLSADQDYKVDEDGYIRLLARFEGTDAMDEEEEELLVMDLDLNLELRVEDSIQMAYITAYTIDSLGEEIPVEELEFIFGVQGMLSVLPLAEDYLEEGEYEAEVPFDIPGDPNGELIFTVVVDESDEFGTVYATQKANWGARSAGTVEEKNELWTNAAPVWMYIVLTIMLVGVWANYVYTVVNLRKIKKMGEN